MPNVFVYGALMTHPVALRSGVGASVADHAVRFLTLGLPFLEPAFALLVPAPGETAFGAIVPFDDATWRLERAAEATYTTAGVRATTLAGDPVEAIALVAGFRTRRIERAPSARYASLLLAGAEHHGLPADVIARYQALRASGPSLTLRLARMLGTDGEARVARARRDGSIHGPRIRP